MESSIVQWVRYDDKLKEYAKKSKKLRDEKDKLSQAIFTQLTIPEGTANKDLPQYVINTDSMNTKVLCHQNTNYEPLNYKFLKESLLDYFQGKTEEPSAITDDIIQYIRSKRKKEIKLILKRDDFPVL